MRICYFGGYDRDHPRNRVILSGLRQAGAEVVECHSRHPIQVLRVPSLVIQYLRVFRKIDVVWVGACGHSYVPLAWLLSRLTRKPFLFDLFVSQFENWTESSGRKRPVGLAGWKAYGLDFFSSHLSDRVLLDTPEHADFFRETFHLPSAQVAWLPVGTAADGLMPRAENGCGPFRVLFAGNFFTFHGVETIVGAAHLLAQEKGLQIELMGKAAAPAGGHLLDGLPVVLRESVPYEEYLGILSQADVALGVFGATPKASRVIPCKVYDALALGVPLVTADTPAVRRLLVGGQSTLLVPPGNPRALADALLLLKRDAPFRKRLGENGRRAFQEKATTRQIGQQALSQCLQLRGTS